MIIYIDVVIILNIFLDFLLLMSVSVILTRNVRFYRIIIGSIIGGGTTFLLFVNVNWFISLILKIIFGIIMVIVTFGYCNIKYTINNIFYLLTTSFILGGVMYLLMDNGFYNYIILIIGFAIVLFFYIKQTKQYQESYSNYYLVEVYFNNKKIILTGYLDTGNKLNDPYKHRPVIITHKKIKYQDKDIIYVPYRSLNNESVLKCIKANKIVINKHVFNNYLIGLSDNKIKIDGVDCILHSKMKGDLHA